MQITFNACFFYFFNIFGTVYDQVQLASALSRFGDERTCVLNHL
jgi:hypothetical protein